MVKKAQQSFTVGFVIKQWVETEIVAPTMEDALATGRKFTVNDVFSLDITTNDSSIKVITVYDHDSEI